MSRVRPALAAFMLALAAHDGRAAGPSPSPAPVTLDASEKYEGKTLREWTDLLGSRDEEVVERAANAIAKYGPNGKSAASALVRVLDRLVISGPVIRALGQIGKPAVAPLIAALENQNANHLGVLQAIAEIGPDAADAVPAVRGVLVQGIAGYRTYAATALGRIGPAAKAAVPDLIVAVKRDGYVAARREAATALGRIGQDPADVVPVLMDALSLPRPEKAGDIDVGKAAAEALAGFGKAAVPPLAKALTSRDTDVRDRAALAISRLLGEGLPAAEAKGMGPDLIALLKDKDASVRRHAAWAIGRLGAAAGDAVGPLSELLADPRHDVREDAAWALGRLGPAAKSAVPALRALLNDPGADVRRAAGEALKAIDPDAAKQDGMK